MALSSNIVRTTPLPPYLKYMRVTLEFFFRGILHSVVCHLCFYKHRAQCCETFRLIKYIFFFLSRRKSNKVRHYNIKYKL